MPSAADKLKKAAGGKSSSKSTSKVPVIQVDDKVGRKIKALRKAKLAVVAAGEQQTNAEADLMETATRFRIDQCKKDKEAHASIKLVSSDGTLTFTQARKYLKMPAETCEAKIRRFVEDDDEFDKNFSVEDTYTLDMNALMALEDADDIVEGLTKALGKHSDKILKCVSVVVPTVQYHKDSITDPATRRLADELEAEGLAVLQKPSFKVT